MQPPQRAALQPSLLRDAGGARGISCFPSFITLKVLIKALQLPALVRRAAAGRDEPWRAACLHGTRTCGSLLPTADTGEVEEF